MLNQTKLNLELIKSKQANLSNRTDLFVYHNVRILIKIKLLHH